MGLFQGRGPFLAKMPPSPWAGRAVPPRVRFCCPWSPFHPFLMAANRGWKQVDLCQKVMGERDGVGEGRGHLPTMPVSWVREHWDLPSHPGKPGMATTALRPPRKPVGITERMGSYAPLLPSQPCSQSGLSGPAPASGTSWPPTGLPSVRGRQRPRDDGHRPRWKGGRSPLESLGLPVGRAGWGGLVPREEAHRKVKSYQPPPPPVGPGELPAEGWTPRAHLLGGLCQPRAGAQEGEATAPAGGRVSEGATCPATQPVPLMPGNKG